MSMLLAPLVTSLSVVGLIAVLYMLYIFANLSQRLGAVTKIRPYYYGFYAAIGFLVVALLARVALSNIALSPASGSEQASPIVLVIYHLPLLIGIAISVLIAWRYWSWLFKEKLQ